MLAGRYTEIATGGRTTTERAQPRGDHTQFLLLITGVGRQ